MHKHAGFLQMVQDYVSKHPDAAAYVSDYVASGIKASQDAALERAADMEIALSAAIAARYKERDDLILSKLKKWQGYTSLNWGHVIEMMESKKSLMKGQQ